MLTKLAFRNVGKSFKDYAIYFFTLVFGVCIFYMFNSIHAQKEVMEVTQTTNAAMEALTKILSYISVFVSIILGFLIVYANNFFIKRRKKELGVYLILGMDKFKISSILVLETSLIAIIALVTGLASGVFLSQFMSVFTAKIFEADLSSYKFIFSPDAMLKSILYFGMIFVVVIMMNTVTVSKQKLIDLVKGGRKNENLKIKSIRLSILLFCISLICLGISYFLIIKNGMININIIFLASLIFGTIGTLLFFFSLTGFGIKMLQKNKKIYYKGLNMFVVRQLNNKINTNFVSMSVVCIVLLLAIGVFSCGFSMQSVLSSDLKNSAPYDMSICNYYDSEQDESTSIVQQLPPNIINNELIKDYDEFIEYNYNQSKAKDILSLSNEQKNDSFFKKVRVEFLSLTDLNEILQMQNKSPINLEQNSYSVLVNGLIPKDKAESIVSENIALNLNGTTLHPTNKVLDVITENRGNSMIFIVNDKYVSDMDIKTIKLNINCVSKEASKELEKRFDEYVNNTDKGKIPFTFYITQSDIYQSSVTTKALVSFLAIYLGFVFIITAAAILALQQLSEVADNKQRYELLSKLGVSKKMMNRALFRQIACYFILPLGLAIIHSIVGIGVANKVIKNFGELDVLNSSFVTAAFIIGIYSLYFGVTYIGSKSMINKNN